MDELAKEGIVGFVRTVPVGMPRGSDVANLSLLDMTQKILYEGRSPIEAANIGIKLGDNDLAIRCNLVTLSEDEPFEEKTMLDYSGGNSQTI